MADWNKIKAEYIAGGTSYRKLAEKYGVSPTTLAKVAGREGWVEARHQADIKKTTKIVNDVSNKNAKIDDKYFRLVDKLMSKAEETIDGLDVWSVTALKEMSTALRYLKECKGIKSDLDVEEQQERINKLRREAQQMSGDEDDDNTGVLMLPNADAPLIDKEESRE